MTLKVIGCDVGGTFTDVILLDQGAGEIRLAKVPTTVGNQADGVLDAIAKAGQSPASVNLIVHGTTTATNALLERKIARCRPDHDQGLPRRAGARAAHAAPRLRHDRLVRAADLARASARGDRAHRRDRQGADVRSTRRGCAKRCGA